MTARGAGPGADGQDSTEAVLDSIRRLLTPVGEEDPGAARPDRLILTAEHRLDGDLAQGPRSSAGAQPPLVLSSPLPAEEDDALRARVAPMVEEAVDRRIAADLPRLVREEVRAALARRDGA